MAEFTIEARLTADGSQFVGEIRKAGNSLEDFEDTSKDTERQTDKTTDALDDGSKGMKRFGDAASVAAGNLAAMAAAFAVDQVLDFVGGIIDAGVQMDRWNSALTAATGSSQGAASAIQFISDEADRLGISVEGATDGFITFAAATKDTVLEGQAARDVFSAFAEASTVLGLSAADTEGVMVALGQAVSKTTLSMEEVQQISERIPGAQQALARAMGLTTAEMVEMVSTGNVLTTDVLPGLAEEISRTFEGGLAEATESAGASFARLQNAVSNLQQAIAQSGLLDLLATVAERLTNIIDLFSEAIRQGKAFASVDADAQRAQLENAIRIRDEYIERVNAMREADKLSAEQSEVAAETIRKYNDEIQSLRVSLGISSTGAVGTGGGGSGRGTIMEPLIIGVQKSNEALTEGVSAMDKYRDSLLNAQEELDSFFDKQELLDDLFQSGAISSEVYNKELERLAGTLAKVESETEDVAETTEDAGEKITRAADPIADAWERAADRINQSFVDLFESALKGFDDFGDQIKNIMRTLLAELAHAAITQPILIRLGVGGALGGGGAGGAGGGGLLGGLLGGGGGLLGSFLPGGGGGAAGGGIGGIGGLLGGLGTAGTLGLGALAVGGLSFLSGAFDRNRIKESQLALGTRPFGTPASTFVRGPLGPLSAGFNRLGNEGQITDQAAQEMLGEIEVLFETVTQIDELIASTLDQFSVDNIRKQLLQEINLGSGSVDDRRIRDFIRARFARTFREVEEGLNQAFLEGTRGGDVDAVIDFANAIAAINQQMVEGNAIFSDIVGTTATVNVLMDQFQQEGEALSATLNRVNQAQESLGLLGLDTGTVAGAGIAAGAQGAAGGQARLAQLINSYLTSFFSQEEILRAQIGRLEPGVSGALGGLGTSAGTFREDFEAIMGSLTGEDLARWLEAGEQLAQLTALQDQLAAATEETARSTESLIDAYSRSTETFEQSIQRQQDEVLRMAFAYDGAADSTNELITASDQLRAAQLQLLQQIDLVSAGIEQSIGGAVRQIELSLLGQEDQYAFLTNEAEALAASIETLTDPAEIQRAVAQAQAATTQALGLLTDEQRQAVGTDFINFLSGLEASAQNQLEQQRQATLDSAERTGEVIEAALNRSAESFNSAAVQMQNAADAMRNAASTMASAARTPVTIQVATDQAVGF